MKLRRSIVNLLLAVAATLVGTTPQTAAAEGLVQLLLLDFTGERVVEEFRAAEFPVEVQRQVLPETLWQSRSDAVPEDPTVLMRFMYTAVSLESDGSWSRSEDPHYSEAHVRPSKSGALILDEDDAALQKSIHVPPSSRLQLLDSGSRSSLEMSYRAPAGGALVLLRKDGLFLQAHPDFPEIELSPLQTRGVRFSWDEHPRIVPVLSQHDEGERLDRLMVWNGDGSVAYEDAEWTAEEYQAWFFGPSDDYVVVVQQVHNEGQGTLSAFVLEIATGERRIVDGLLPSSVHNLTADRRYLLALSQGGDDPLSGEAQLFALDATPQLPLLWAHQFANRLFEGAISDESGTVVLRAEVSPEETEIWLVDRDGHVTRTGQHEANGARGISILPGGFVVTGAQMSQQRRSAGGQIAVYQIMDSGEPPTTHK